MTPRLLQLPASQIRKGDQIAPHGMARGIDRTGPFDASGDLVKVVDVGGVCHFPNPSDRPGGMERAILISWGSVGSGLWFDPDRLVYVVRKVAP